MPFERVCSADYNQSAECLPIEARGRQYVANCMMFLIAAVEKACSTMSHNDLHEFMHYGSFVYCEMKKKGHEFDYLSPTELPRCVKLRSKLFHVEHKEVVSGVIETNPSVDNVSSFRLENALVSQMLSVPVNLFFICSGISLGIHYDGLRFYVFDSHSRDAFGMSCAEGFCILGSLANTEELCFYLRLLLSSMGLSLIHLQFDLHRFQIRKARSVSYMRSKVGIMIIPEYVGRVQLPLPKKHKLSSTESTDFTSKRQRLVLLPHGKSFLYMLDDRHISSTHTPSVISSTSNTCQESIQPHSDQVIRTVNVDVQSSEHFNAMLREFTTLICRGPDYVCSCCTQTFFRHSVNDSSKMRLNDTAQQNLSKYLTGRKSVDNKEWICKTCSQAVRNGRIPSLWIHNGLQFPVRPPELSLTNLEERLVSPRLPFMQLREMPRGGQINLKGNIVNVPADVNSTIKSLPRLINESETIMVKLKRKLSYKHHVAFENIRPNKVFSAAKWLVDNSCVFRNEGIVTNDSWLEDSHKFPSADDTLNSAAENCPSSDNWTEEDNEERRPTGNFDTFLHPLDFREFNQILSVAPGEHNTPIGLFQDVHSEVLSFPTIYCGQPRVDNSKRLVPLHYSTICKWELRNVDRRVAMCLPNIFFKLKRLQIKQLRDKVTLAVRKCKTKGKTFTAGDILSPGFVDRLTMQDDGYRVLRTIRGSPPYWEQAKRDVFAMIRQLGIPTWFCSFSAAETKWEPLLKSLQKLINEKDLADEEIKKLSWAQKCELIKSDPVTCARYFDYRVQIFISHILRNATHPIGEITDYFYRVEFQQRGSPHIHMLVWVKDAPIHGVSPEHEVASFVDKYISCSKDESMPLLVNYQTHRHAKSCRKHGKSVCRFSFPLPPMPSTVVLQPLDSETDKTVHKRNYEKVMDLLNQIHKEDRAISLNDILVELKLTFEQYILCVRSSLKSSKVFLKRSPVESRINNYNTVLLKTWQANMDIQYILDPYACVSYIVSYISKGQRGLSNLLQQASQEARELDSDIRQQVRRIGNQFLTHVEIGAQEAAYLVLQMPLRRSTRDVIYVDTNRTENRTVLLKSFTDLQELPETSKNVEADSVLKRYRRRPKVLESVCYVDFAAWFELCPGRHIDKSYNGSENSELLETNYELDSCDDISADVEVSAGQEIKFPDGTRIKKRHTKKIIYCHFTSLNTDSEEYYREHIMLYTNWRDEDRDFPKGHDTYKSHYQEFETLILNKKAEYERIDRHLYNHLSEMEFNEYPNSLDPQGQQQELLDEEEGSTPSQFYGCFDPGKTSEQYDIGQDLGISRTHVCSELPSHEIENEKFLQMAIQLNERQQAFFYHVLHSVKTKSDPIYAFLSGGAGVGKSVVLKVLYQALLKYFSHKRGDDPSSIKLLLCAPTGKAAHNIGGSTIHSAFCVPANQKYDFKPLDMQQLNAMRSRYAGLKIVFIDEISMVGRQLFNYINLRLQEIMGCTMPFGGVSIVAFGDLFQLRPVMDSWIFSNVHPVPNLNCLAGNLWQDLFTMYELTEVMRQKDDLVFAQLLNRLREGCQTDDDMNMLRARQLTNLNLSQEDVKNVPHLYCIKELVNSHNNSLLSTVEENNKASIAAIDNVSGNFTESVVTKILAKIPSDSSKTMGLQNNLTLGLNMPAEMCVNVDVTDGLTNGAACVVRHFDYRVVNSRRCSIIWVEFDDKDIGKAWKTKYKHLYTSNISQTWVPILETTRNFTIQYFKTYSIVRRQFPLKMAAAKTIHKSQGSTMQEAVIHFGTRKLDHVHYVALSRLTHLSGVFVSELNDRKISVSTEVMDEMLRLRHEKSLSLCVPDLSSCITDKMTICFQNCRSLRKHIKSIRNEKNIQNSDIIAFAETRLPVPVNGEFELEGFSMFSSEPEQSAHGLAVYYKIPNLTFTAATFGGIECIFCRLPTDTDTYLCFIYCPPKCATVRNFKEFMSKIVHKIPSCARTILMGDVNEDYFATTSISNFLCTTNNFEQLIHTPTTDYGSCLDHIYVNFRQGTYQHLFQYGTLESYYSDHKPIYLKIPRQIKTCALHEV